ncbi:MAG TPA: hypothetical protein VMM76_05425 [Pirellulaceae bacterium]|nr:hypothetical protein [Pirellulaceae bacterium]
MTSQHSSTKRWRPRFSVRTLVIVVTLVCCYAACWGPTKTRGVANVADRIEGEFYCIPLTNSGKLEMRASSTIVVPFVVQHEYPNGTRHFYFWLFGYVAKLPIERETRLPSI